MSEKLEFTGERFTPECVREIRYEHFHRYAFAAQWCRDAHVLDAACGEGYGSALLAQFARRVVGVDISKEAVVHAQQRYQEMSNLDFKVADVINMPFPDGTFDRVVSFETLEHLREQEQLLGEFRRVLKPDGLLILSSPDKAVYSDQNGFENEFHVRELYREELEDLIGKQFPASVLLGQKLMFHSVIWPQGGAHQVQLQTLRKHGILAEGSLDTAPVYFLALCAAREELLPDITGRMWLFGDDEESVYAHYYHEIRKNMAAGQLLAEREAEIEELKLKLAKRAGGWWQRWFRRG